MRIEIRGALHAESAAGEHREPARKQELFHERSEHLERRSSERARDYGTVLHRREPPIRQTPRARVKNYETPRDDVQRFRLRAVLQRTQKWRCQRSSPRTLQEQPSLHDRAHTVGPSCSRARKCASRDRVFPH